MPKVVYAHPRLDPAEVEAWATEHVGSPLYDRVAGWRPKLSGVTRKLYRGLGHPYDPSQRARLASWTDDVREARCWGRFVLARDIPIECVVAVVEVDYGAREYVVLADPRWD